MFNIGDIFDIRFFFEISHVSSTFGQKNLKLGKFLQK